MLHSTAYSAASYVTVLFAISNSNKTKERKIHRGKTTLPLYNSARYGTVCTLPGGVYRMSGYIMMMTAILITLSTVVDGFAIDF